MIKQQSKQKENTTQDKLNKYYNNKVKRQAERERLSNELFEAQGDLNDYKYHCGAKDALETDRIEFLMLFKDDIKESEESNE